MRELLVVEHDQLLKVFLEMARVAGVKPTVCGYEECLAIVLRKPGKGRRRYYCCDSHRIKQWKLLHR